MEKKSVSFEQAFNELEALVERLANGQLSLEESLKDFERGVNLTKQCQDMLSNAEQKVQTLLEQDSSKKDAKPK